MTKDKNKVIIPTKETNGKLRRNIIAGLVIVAVTTLFGMLGWLFLQSFESAKIDAARTEQLIRIEENFTDHCEWGEAENKKNKERLEALEKQEHPSTADRWTKHQALLADEQDKRWTIENFIKKDK